MNVGEGAVEIRDHASLAETLFFQALIRGRFTEKQIDFILDRIPL